MAIVIYMAIKIRDLQVTFKKSNQPWSWSKYWETEAVFLLITVAFAVVWLLSKDDLFNHRPEFKWLARVLTFFIVKDSVFVIQRVTALFKQQTTRKFINNVIDKKTDIADGKAPPNTPDNEQ